MIFYSPAYFEERKGKIDAVIAVMDEWFWAIENGTSDKRRPDPKGIRYSKEDVDTLIKHIDDFTEREYTMHPTYRNFVGKTHPAGFGRLKGASREAFVQAIRKVKAEQFQNQE